MPCTPSCAGAKKILGDRTILPLSSEICHEEGRERKISSENSGTATSSKDASSTKTQLLAVEVVEVVEEVVEVEEVVLVLVVEEVLEVVLVLVVELVLEVVLDARSTCEKVKEQASNV